HVDVEQHQVGRRLVEELQRLLAVRCLADDLAPHRADDGLHEKPYVRLVVGQQHADLALLAHGLAPGAGPSGAVTVNRVPCPGALSTSMCPPCASTIFLTMARPRPVLFSPPVGRALSFWNERNRS